MASLWLPRDEPSRGCCWRLYATAKTTTTIGRVRPHFNTRATALILGISGGLPPAGKVTEGLETGKKKAKAPNCLFLRNHDTELSQRSSRVGVGVDILSIKDHGCCVHFLAGYFLISGMIWGKLVLLLHHILVWMNCVYEYERTKI